MKRIFLLLLFAPMLTVAQSYGILSGSIGVKNLNENVLSFLNKEKNIVSASLSGGYNRKDGLAVGLGAALFSDGDNQVYPMYGEFGFVKSNKPFVLVDLGVVMPGGRFRGGLYFSAKAGLDVRLGTGISLAPFLSFSHLERKPPKNLEQLPKMQPVETLSAGLAIVMH